MHASTFRLTNGTASKNGRVSPVAATPVDRHKRAQSEIEHVTYCHRLGGSLRRCKLASETAGFDSGSGWREGFEKMVKVRNVYNSQTGQLLRTPDEFEETLKVTVSAAAVGKANRLVEQFDDISLHQKEFLKLWNTFVRLYPVHGQLYVQDACTTFAFKHRALLRSHYRHSFLLHLINLHNMSLIHPEAFALCVAYLDDDDIDGPEAPTQNSDTVGPPQKRLKATPTNGTKKAD